MYLTGIADEASQDINEQISATKELGWNAIESRFINGKNIHDVLELTIEQAIQFFSSASTILKKLPKKSIASKSLKNFGLAIYAGSIKKILEIVNTIAPEHLELCTKNNKKIIRGVKNAGSIFEGKFSPEAIGDYIAGPNHVLPTSGSARFSSGLSVNDFLKRQSLIKITKTGIERLSSSVINLAKHENLDGHAYSVKIRLKKGRLIGKTRNSGI